MSSKSGVPTLDSSPPQHQQHRSNCGSPWVDSSSMVNQTVSFFATSDGHQRLSPTELRQLRMLYDHFGGVTEERLPMLFALLGISVVDMDVRGVLQACGHDVRREGTIIKADHVILFAEVLKTRYFSGEERLNSYEACVDDEVGEVTEGSIWHTITRFGLKWRQPEQPRAAQPKDRTGDVQPATETNSPVSPVPPEPSSTTTPGGAAGGPCSTPYKGNVVSPGEFAASYLRERVPVESAGRAGRHQQVGKKSSILLDGSQVVNVREDFIGDADDAEDDSVTTSNRGEGQLRFDTQPDEVLLFGEDNEAADGHDGTRQDRLRSGMPLHQRLFLDLPPADRVLQWSDDPNVEEINQRLERRQQQRVRQANAVGNAALLRDNGFQFIGRWEERHRGKKEPKNTRNKRMCNSFKKLQQQHHGNHEETTGQQHNQQQQRPMVAAGSGPEAAQSLRSRAASRVDRINSGGRQPSRRLGSFAAGHGSDGAGLSSIEHHRIEFSPATSPRSQRQISGKVSVAYSPRSQVSATATKPPQQHHQPRVSVGDGLLAVGSGQHGHTSGVSSTAVSPRWDRRSITSADNNPYAMLASFAWTENGGEQQRQQRHATVTSQGGLNDDVDGADAALPKADVFNRLKAHNGDPKVNMALLNQYVRSLEQEKTKLEKQQKARVMSASERRLSRRISRYGGPGDEGATQLSTGAQRSAGQNVGTRQGGPRESVIHHLAGARKGSRWLEDSGRSSPRSDTNSNSTSDLFNDFRGLERDRSRSIVAAAAFRQSVVK